MRMCTWYRTLTRPSVDSVPEPSRLARLLTLARSGDESALADLLSSQYDRLTRKIASQLPFDMRQSISEEDILQDTFISVFQSFGSLNCCSAEAFLAWLDSVVRNQLIDAIRRSKSKKRGGDYRRRDNAKRPSTGSVVQLVALLFGNELTPSLNVARTEAMQALVNAIDELPSEQGLAVRLRCLDGYSISAVALEMQRSEDSIRNLIYRGKENLRKTMRASGLWLDKK